MSSGDLYNLILIGIISGAALLAVLGFFVYVSSVWSRLRQRLEDAIAEMIETRRAMEASPLFNREDAADLLIGAVRQAYGESIGGPTGRRLAPNEHRGPRTRPYDAAQPERTSPLRF